MIYGCNHIGKNSGGKKSPNIITNFCTIQAKGVASSIQNVSNPTMPYTMQVSKIAKIRDIIIGTTYAILKFGIGPKSNKPKPIPAGIKKQSFQEKTPDRFEIW